MKFILSGYKDLTIDLKFEKLENIQIFNTVTFIKRLYSLAQHLYNSSDHNLLFTHMEINPNLTKYTTTLQTLVLRVKQAQYNALRAFSVEKVTLAWDFSRLISSQDS